MPKSDIILLKMDSGDAWFADASLNGTTFKFLMDTGASKCVMSSKWFMSIPEMFLPNLCNTRMKFQLANREVLNSIGVAHVSTQRYGYTFKLPIFVCDLGDIDCIFGLDAGKKASFITCA
ncbi:MAG: retroviral-like aspartic protease [Sulfurospirillum sp.]|nr:retroviral-like aspartic protease [Sulfurospirillum sp.]